MYFNQNTPPKIKSENSDHPINNVTNFKYLGAWKLSSEKVFENRKALAYTKIKSIWNSKMNICLKIKTFKVTRTNPTLRKRNLDNKCIST